MINIQKGKIKKPVVLAVYGVEGIGKTTFASKMPGALVIDLECGSYNYDVARVGDVNTWEMLLETLKELFQKSEDFQKSGIKTIVFDTVDKLENDLLIPFTLKKANKNTLAEMEWGRGYESEGRNFSDFLAVCDALKTKGYNLVFVVHSTQKEINPPDNIPFSHYELKLNKKVSALLKEYVDMLLFFNFKTLVVRDKNGSNKGQAVERVMVCNHTAYADAKNRFGLETVLPLNAGIISKLF